MKKMTIQVKRNEKKEMREIPAINFASDFFKCDSCGYTVRMLVRGNTAHCSQCGGTMYRC